MTAPTNGQPIEEIKTIVWEAETIALSETERLDIIEALKPITSNITEYREFAESFECNTEDDAAMAANTLALIAKDLKTVEEKTEPWRKRVFDFHRRITGGCNLLTKPLESFRKTIKASVANWQAAEQRKAEEIQHKLQAEAEEKARKERERADELARKAEARGDQEKAAAYAEKSAAIVAPVIKVAAPTTQGVRLQKRWYVSKVDKAAFVKAAAENPQLLGYIIVEETALARTKSSNTQFDAPGIVFSQKSV